MKLLGQKLIHNIWFLLKQEHKTTSITAKVRQKAEPDAIVAKKFRITPLNDIKTEPTWVSDWAAFI